MSARERPRAPRNRTLEIDEAETKRLVGKTRSFATPASPDELRDSIIRQDLFELLPLLPDEFVDLLVVDPPYNIDKKFGAASFAKLDDDAYERWLERWLAPLVRTLKPTGSAYICGDWRSSSAIHRVGKKLLTPANRVTWEREKGRAAKRNWKNCSEDIWFFVKSDDYYFDADAVRLKRKVIAPYRENGAPKDWRRESDGDYRLTAPSNIWTDVTVPFWSMPENTDHPAQKPEKLMAKLILASSRRGDLVFDPFCGSGAGPAAAKKLGRAYLGVEIDERYAALAVKRLELAEENADIQGYEDGVFYERNALAGRRRKR
ncbi:MAG: site-specific DNA-methyltransferase [Ignavibacteriales bacterium]|nr:site-specific DNA-methyltransferase [Ignavibacteriales bacterium]